MEATYDNNELYEACAMQSSLTKTLNVHDHCVVLRTTAKASVRSRPTLALLPLKPRKCFIVPLWAAASPATIAQTKSLLAELGPSWSGFSVAGRAEYFGTFLGPEASLACQWLAPGQK